jgi:hypothetical protein
MTLAAQIFPFTTRLTGKGRAARLRSSPWQPWRAGRLPNSFITSKGESFMQTRTSGESEDRYTGAIETQTSKMPSSLFLGLALGSMGASLILKIMEKNEWALFVGQWAAPFLIMGNYNKMVKQHGSDRESRDWAA